MINLADIKEFNQKFDNRYELKEKIGGGGFSEVWLAHDTNADIDVALKIYTPNGALDEEGKEDFKREFARLCSLNHSNIIHAIGFGIHDEELPYLAMSVCKNGSAKNLIGRAEEEQLWNFIEQVSSGLHYLHAHNITHQDIKPDNVLVNSDGQFLIIDFGISTKTRNTLRNTNQGSVGGGTPWYMSVESWGTESPNIQARDIWAFGASLYEIITGDVPFGQYGGLTQKAQNGKIPPIKKDISEELKQLVYDCLSLNAWERPDAEAIVSRVQNHKAGVHPSKPNKGYMRKSLGMATVLLFVVTCCYAGYTYLGQKSNHDQDTSGKDMVEVNKYDSIFLAKVNEAVKIAEPERNKSNLSTVDERTLCSAAQIYADAILLDASDSVKRQGSLLWLASQQLIDSTYDYLYNRSVEYSRMEADVASQKLQQRCTLLNAYVTPSKRNAEKSVTGNAYKTNVVPTGKRTNKSKTKGPVDQHIESNLPQESLELTQPKKTMLN